MADISTKIYTLNQAEKSCMKFRVKSDKAAVGKDMTIISTNK